MSDAPKVAFRSMKAGTAADYDLIRRVNIPSGQVARDIALRLLAALDDDPGAFLINRYHHSLQTATRAVRDHAGEEQVVCALFHDIGDTISPFNHPAASAEVLRPFVGDDSYHIVRHHGLFQSYYYAHHLGGDRNAREEYAGQSWYRDCIEFCERWDQASFDPDYETFPLETFMPMVDSVFARRPNAAGRSPIIEPAPARH